MKATPERLHIDELKRVEQQTNELLKAWRKMNIDYTRLQEDFNGLNERYDAAKEQHAEHNTKREEASREALEALERNWQTRYDEEKTAWRQERAALIASHEQAILEQQQRYEASISALEQELKQTNERKQILIDRIRGIDYE